MWALPCGHLFHRDCVQQWFNASRVGRRGSGTCPSCKANTTFSKALRIFPAEDDEQADAAAKENRDLTALIAEKQNVESKLKDVTKELKNLKAQFEIENENLRMKNGELLSKLDHQEEQIKEYEDMKKAFENSFKTAFIEQLTKDPFEFVAPTCLTNVLVPPLSSVENL